MQRTEVLSSVVRTPPELDELPLSLGEHLGKPCPELGERLRQRFPLLPSVTSKIGRLAARADATDEDVVGACAAPAHSAGFALALARSSNEQAEAGNGLRILRKIRLRLAPVA